MIKQLLYYYKTEHGVPTDEDLIQCLSIQDENPDKIVILKYYKNWSGWYEVWFDDKFTLEEVRKSMPKGYPV